MKTLNFPEEMSEWTKDQWEAIGLSAKLTHPEHIGDVMVHHSLGTFKVLLNFRGFESYETIVPGDTLTFFEYTTEGCDLKVSMCSSHHQTIAAQESMETLVDSIANITETALGLVGDSQ